MLLKKVNLSTTFNTKFTKKLQKTTKFQRSIGITHRYNAIHINHKQCSNWKFKKYERLDFDKYSIT